MVAKSFSGRYPERDRALFVLMVYTGARISEALSLRLGDVIDRGQLVTRIVFARRTLKGGTQPRTKIRSREVPLHPRARAAMMAWLPQLHEFGWLRRDCFVFQAQTGRSGPLSISRASEIFKVAFARAGLTGRLATHSCRKTFAERMRRALGGDILKVARALGHVDVKSTMAYLSVSQAEIDRAILGKKPRRQMRAKRKTPSRSRKA